MTPERRAMLKALAAAHDEFVARRLADSPFAPEGRPATSDYNLHFVDLEADDDQFHEAARQILEN